MDITAIEIIHMLERSALSCRKSCARYLQESEEANDREEAGRLYNAYLRESATAIHLECILKDIDDLIMKRLTEETDTGKAGSGKDPETAAAPQCL